MAGGRRGPPGAPPRPWVSTPALAGAARLTARERRGGLPARPVRRSTARCHRARQLLWVCWSNKLQPAGALGISLEVAPSISTIRLRSNRTTIATRGYHERSAEKNVSKQPLRLTRKLIHNRCGDRQLAAPQLPTAAYCLCCSVWFSILARTVEK